MKLRSNSRTNIQRIVTITAGAALLVGTESATGAAFAENNNGDHDGDKNQRAVEVGTRVEQHKSRPIMAFLRSPTFNLGQYAPLLKMKVYYPPLLASVGQLR
jgi:hypothetical protein